MILLLMISGKNREFYTHKWVHAKTEEKLISRTYLDVFGATNVDNINKWRPPSVQSVIFCRPFYS